MKKSLIVLIVSFVVISCGWNDSKINEKKLVGNYSIVLNPNDKRAGNILAKMSDNGYKVVLENCKEVYFNDSFILLSVEQYGGELKYHQIFVNDTNNKMNSLTKNEFVNLIDKCENKALN